VFDEILIAVKNLASTYAVPYSMAIIHGSLPQENGLAMYAGPGGEDAAYLDRGGTYSIDLVLNGKHSNRQTVASALSNIHVKLSQLKSYPKGEGWEITNIRSGTAPNLIEQEASSNQWVYGSILEVTFEMKGV
jgi:hypothetical protein